VQSATTGETEMTTTVTTTERRSADRPGLLRGPCMGSAWTRGTTSRRRRRDRRALVVRCPRDARG